MIETLNTLNHIASLAKQHNRIIATAESITAGGIAKALTNISGASEWFAGGVVSYQTDVKTDVLGVSQSVIDENTVVSEEVAKEMCKGVLRLFKNADTAVSITGEAGPKASDNGQPVGTVCIGIQVDEEQTSSTHVFKGNRDEIRQQATEWAIAELCGVLQTKFEPHV